MSTHNPANGVMTNKWKASSITDVRTDGAGGLFIAYAPARRNPLFSLISSSRLLPCECSLPGSLLKARTMLELRMGGESAAASLAQDLGWEVEGGASSSEQVEGTGDVTNAPITTAGGEAFVFRH